MNPNDQQEPIATPVPPPAPAATQITTPPVATDESNTMVMSILAYIGILVLIPLLVAKDNPTVKFHIKQGLVLFIAQVALYVVGSMSYGMMFGMLAPIMTLVNLALIVLAIIGIVNAVKKQEKELPLIGSLAKHLPI
jgi:uncharacterized membrane protein